ncbi:MAG: hypothetical protein WB985_16400 [Candidatus Acidiferrales bacterium]
MISKCGLAPIIGCTIFAFVTGSAVPARQNSAPPVHLTNEQEHQREMEALHIASVRHGAEGNADSPYAANYDEAKVPPYPPPPDPLVMNNGKKVGSAKMWRTKLRPEIVELFDREIYGRVPKNVPPVKWEVLSTTNEKHGDVAVVTKKLAGPVDNSSYPLITVEIQLTVSTPADAKGPVPVIMELGIDPAVMAEFRKRMTPEQLKAFEQSGPTWQQQVRTKGWGYATYLPTSVQPDNGEGLTQGIIGLCNNGQPRKLDDWGALRAWAWGASRALDDFETDTSVDAKQVGLEGHSRYGKAALVAMAYNQRFAIGSISSSGAGGARVLRRDFGERLENLTSSYSYHWMAGNLIKYGGPGYAVNGLPIDAHELVALCAPRPVLISGGNVNGHGWVDAKGMWLAAELASPVSVLLGKKRLSTPDFPPMETGVLRGDIAFRQHSGGHAPGPNWPTFIEFASRYLHGRDVPAGSAAAAD